jgi:hypothetical protein
MRQFILRTIDRVLYAIEGDANSVPVPTYPADGIPTQSGIAYVPPF